jgi:hypothetical protein
MALPTRQCILLVTVLAGMSIPAGSDDGVDVTGGYSLPNCDRDPRWPSTAKGAAFRASLAPLLAALPSAAAPTGYASLRSGNGLAFARGLCFGESPPPDNCRECLSISAGRIGICNGSRRAGFWNAGCFLAYADTNASSASEDEQVLWTSFDYDGGVPNYYPEFYDVYQLVNLALSLAPRAANGSSSHSGRMLATANAAVEANSTVRALAQCPGNVTAADCARCLERSAQDVPRCLKFGRYEDDGVQSAGVANVFRYKCYLRLNISAPMLPTMAMGSLARIREFPDDPLSYMIVRSLYYSVRRLDVFLIAAVCVQERG